VALADGRLVGPRLERPTLALPTESLQIESIIAGGDGLGRLANGKVVFVSRTAPGDRVEVELQQDRHQWARGRATRIVEASAQRQQAPCPYYDVCGACQLQHLRYEAQVEAKVRIIADSLRRLGGLDIDPPEVSPSAKRFEYRNRVTLVLRRDGNRVSAGFHALADPAAIVDVESCPLAVPSINAAWAALRAAWGEGAEFLPKGDELRLTVRSTEGGEVGLAIEGGVGKGEPEALLDSVDALSAIWAIDEQGDPAWWVGEPTLSDRWGSHSVQVAGTTFLQVNHDVGKVLDAYVRERAGQVAGARVIDAYCGFGLRALDLAWAGARVVGIDADPHGIAMAQEEAVESGASARFVEAYVEDVLSSELPAELVILNPPRRGVHADVVEALLAHPPGRIIYVSCDPATLARDLKMLGEKYSIESLRGFDMFPQTAHVETVVTLSR
jgi:23S rRNA (uracil1939-C5)-methyltransferase